MFVISKNFTRRPSVTRAFCVGAIISSAIGIYGSITLEKVGYSWMFLIVMTLGNAACVFGSMIFGFESLAMPTITFSAPGEDPSVGTETRVEIVKADTRVEIIENSANRVRTLPDEPTKAKLLETRL